MLWLFYDAEDLGVVGRDDYDSFRVLCADVHTGDLHLAEVPEGLEDHNIFAPLPLSFVSEIPLPTGEPDLLDSLLSSPDEADAYEEFAGGVLVMEEGQVSSSRPPGRDTRPGAAKSSG